jgi:hypothetical protein
MDREIVPEAMSGFGASGGSMRFRLPYLVVGIATAWVLAAPTAHAFTVENKDAAGQYGVPKFDLEEQSKNFRKDGAGATTSSNGLFETPLGNGKLQFGIQPGGSSNFGSVFSPQLGPSLSVQQSRQEFDRRLAPPTSLEYNGVR